MKTNAEKLESLLRLSNTSFKTLKPDSRDNGTYIVPIMVTNYSDSLYMATDIIKLCIIALAADGEGLTASVLLNMRVNVTSMLEIVLQFLPIEEMEVLDELQKLLKQKKEEETNTAMS